MTQAITKNHFSLEEWADFSRRQLSTEIRAGMQQHLDHGCSQCSQVVHLWDSVLGMAARDSDFEPPASAVRCAKALYAALPPQKTAGLALRIAHLAGFRQPVLEGVRGAAPAPSHLLFQEGTLLLDMYLQRQTASERISVVGQVMDSTRPDQPFENQPVVLVHEGTALARTTTNEFGEFRLEFVPNDDLLLMIELENRMYLVSPLPTSKEG
jgi:hypothetical protein